MITQNAGRAARSASLRQPSACALQVLVIDSGVLLQLLSSRGFSSPYLVNSML